MTTIQVTPEQLASLLLINNSLLDIAEQGADSDILEELQTLQPELEQILEQVADFFFTGRQANAKKSRA